MKSLMAGLIDPAADAVWASVSISVTREGEEHTQPQTDEEWTAVRLHALSLAEGGNLLLLPSRVADDAWTPLALDLVDVGAEAAAAAASKNSEALLDVGGKIYDVCVACHAKYLPPELAPEF